MRKWLPISLCMVAGLALGFATGFVIYLNHTIFNNPAMVNIPVRGDAFNRVLESMARLSSDEEIVTSGSKRSSLALNNEQEMLRRLNNVGSAAFSPPIKVAEARLLVRRSFSISQHDPQTDARMQLLLEESGWAIPTPDHMRELIRTIDRNREDICSCDSHTAKESQRK